MLPQSVHPCVRSVTSVAAIADMFMCAPVSGSSALPQLSHGTKQARVCCKSFNKNATSVLVHDQHLEIPPVGAQYVLYNVPGNSMPG